jgi:hypothetical protein
MIDLDGKQRNGNNQDAIATEPSDEDADAEKPDKKPEVSAISGEFGLHTDQFDRRNAALKRSTAAIASRDWTDQETMLLLEGLEMYKDDWNKGNFSQVFFSSYITRIYKNVSSTSTVFVMSSL